MAKNILDTGARISYIFCNTCGREPGRLDEPNYAPLRWWDPDSGWKIGTLCRWCWNEFGGARPQPGDCAYDLADHVGAEDTTDEDSYDAIANLER